MDKSAHVYGEYLLSTPLDEQVREAVADVLEGNRLQELSHLDDDCHLCRTAPEPEPVTSIRIAPTQAIAS